MGRSFWALLLALASLTTFAIASVSAGDRFPAVRANVPPPQVASARAAVWRLALVARNFYNYSVRRPAGLATTARFLYETRLKNQDLLYVEYGTSAAPQTLHRFIVKYVFHAGGSSGT